MAQRFLRADVARLSLRDYRGLAESCFSGCLIQISRNTRVHASRPLVVAASYFVRR
jgi:hypothetical protein